MNWKELGLKMGLEIHQQLNTKSKLFCSCSNELSDKKFDKEIKRYLRPTQSELGQIDRAALQESLRNLSFYYQIYDYETCLVESDDEPPHNLNEEALDLSIAIASLLNMSTVDEIHTMRKQVLDGSDTSGFQRTALIATDGYIDTDYGRIAIENLCLEEDAGRRMATNNEFTTFRLDRLGIPLVEITTDPSIHDPYEVKEVAYILGQILRSTNVKRGLGTIRQDLNVSISEGSRVEIKGVQDLDLIPKMVELEVQRQLNLIKIKNEIEKRDANVLNEIFNVDNVFKNTSSKIISKAKSVMAIVLKGFHGLIGLELQTNRRFGTELSDHAKKHGVSGIFHTDELPAYGITEDEVLMLKKFLNISNEDVIIFVAADEDVAIFALKEVMVRVKMAYDGVPEETRKALEDGTSEYMRPLPTANRMYLETDIPLLKINKGKMASILNNLPELIDEKKSRLIKEYKISEDLTNQLIKKGFADEFEEILSELEIDPITVGSFYAYTLKELKRDKIATELLTINDIKSVFKLLKDELISKEGVNYLIKEVAILKEKNEIVKIDYKKISEKLNLLLLPESDVRNIITKIVDKNKNMVEERKMAAIGPLMGMSMKELKGKADGKVVNKIVKEEIQKMII
ncbi:MAG: Glu-tRNA(Gln) amidotransferase subunit GatE [Methanobrevibacter sp.]|jgi:glutamyl-tRNA(Gln) amidotransferase subunit E|nr:Glu-tRNA(Gln) amidotransferase subunit GatE [Candidatus Methanovirga basalitermitum]